MKDEIKFNLSEDIIMQIEMASYMEYNSKIASINEHLGEIYGYSDLKDAEESQLHYEKELAYKAIQKLQEENKKLKEINKEQANHLISKENLSYEDYKSRIDKAIEYIHNHQPVFELSNKEQIQEWFEKEYYVELLNILQGDDESENKSNK